MRGQRSGVEDKPSKRAHRDKSGVLDDFVWVEGNMCVCEALRTGEAHADSLPESNCTARRDEEKCRFSTFGSR